MVALLLSTADTDVLAAARSDGGWRVANPSRVDVDQIPSLLQGVDLVVVRLLGGRRTWPDGLDAVLASGVPTVVLGGESTPDAELMALSSVPAGVATEALGYLAQGGTANLRQLASFLSDTVLLTGQGFEPPTDFPMVGAHERTSLQCDGPRVGVLYYRAHELSGNTAFVDTLCDAIEAAGGTAAPVFCGSLRGLRDEDADAQTLLSLLSGCDVVVTTVLAAGGAVATDAVAGGDDEAWDAGLLAGLDVPVVQVGVGRGADADGRGDAGRHPRVRRAPDREPVLVQGD